ncbi:transporter substrate-binding domain-containing protein [Vibrio profundum]|uniref:substrate-binding periplasmic protein n=1 Tax=Vibrio profundum TaxID=2910247 RepID=UPI003D099FE5
MDKTKPFCYQEHGVGKGMLVDVSEVLSDRLGRPIEIHILPIKHALQKLKSGVYDMVMPLTYTKPSVSTKPSISTNQIDESFHFLSAPLFSFRNIIYGKQDRFFNYTQVSDLFGKTLGMRRDFDLSVELSQAISDGEVETSLVNTDRQLVEMLVTGRVDIIATHNYVIPQNQDVLSDRFVFYGYLDNLKSLRAAISRKSDLNQSFDKVDKVLSEMSRDGTLAEIAKRHKAFNVACKQGVTC